MTTSKSLAAFACAASLLALAGCANKASPDNVDRRAVERWNLLISHEADKAWDYLTPGYRATQPRGDYAKAMNTRPVVWKSATFHDKDCDAQRCTVHVDVTYGIPMPGMPGKTSEATSRQTETWLLVDGDWYFLPST
jgi:hypothetical protein